MPLPSMSTSTDFERELEADAARDEVEEVDRGVAGDLEQVAGDRDRRARAVLVADRDRAAGRSPSPQFSGVAPVPRLILSSPAVIASVTPSTPSSWAAPSVAVSASQERGSGVPGVAGAGLIIATESWPAVTRKPGPSGTPTNSSWTVRLMRVSAAPVRTGGRREVDLARLEAEADVAGDEAEDVDDEAAGGAELLLGVLDRVLAGDRRPSSAESIACLQFSARSAFVPRLISTPSSTHRGLEVVAEALEAAAADLGRDRGPAAGVADAPRA